MSDALGIVRKLFPNVNKVKDAKKQIEIEVTAADNKSAAVRNHKSCAMAVACKRKLKADGVIISVSTAYVVMGDLATRYKVPESVGREIVSFDRDAGFSPGQYQLSPPSKSNQLGHMSGGNTNGSTKKQIIRQHMTSGIRTSLKEQQLA